MCIFCNDKDILRRLEQSEDHVKSCNDRTAKALVVEAELTAEIKDVAKFFQDYTTREELAMKERTQKEAIESHEKTAILLKIKDDINSINTELKSQPKDVAILLLKQKDDMNKQSNDKFATKVQVANISKIGKAAGLFVGGSLLYLLNKIFYIIDFIPMAQ